MVVVVVAAASRDAVDWIEFGAQVVGALVGLAAILIALWGLRGARAAERSSAESAKASRATADAAGRSAVAAELAAAATVELVKTARRDLELAEEQASRKPELRLDDVSVVGNVPPYDGIVAVKLLNSGTASCDDAVLEILGPEGTRVWLVANAEGRDAREIHGHASGLPQPYEWRFTHAPITLSPNAPVVLHFAIDDEELISFAMFRRELRVRLVHAAAVEPAEADIEV